MSYSNYRVRTGETAAIEAHFDALRSTGNYTPNEIRAAEQQARATLEQRYHREDVSDRIVRPTNTERMFQVPQQLPSDVARATTSDGTYGRVGRQEYFVPRGQHEAVPVASGTVNQIRAMQALTNTTQR